MSKDTPFSDKYTILHDGPVDNLRDILLANRGVAPDEYDDFLAPRWEAQHDPFDMHNMSAVVERVHQAIEAGEHTVIYSDYDADGVPGAVILSDCFDRIGYANYTVHIPNRNTDGFGLNATAVEQFITDGVDLVITIDCGIADLAEISGLQEDGVDVIITDHHLPSPDGLPDCLVLDPKQPDCNYPFPDLCGSGVVFKLVQALLQHLRSHSGPTTVKIDDIPEGWEKWLLDMVGIATICDMVPLVGENRVFAYYGLQVLRKSPRPGLQKLLALARANQRTLSAQDVAFSIGPRINAASRIGDPMTAYYTLRGTKNDPDLIAQATASAEELERLNRRRKTVTAAAAKSAYKKIDAHPDSPVVVVGDTEWPLGIVGLIASNIAERYSKPAFVWTRVGDMYKGSVRSGGTCSIHTLMQQAPDAFVSFGGHDAAGGFVCDDSTIHNLSEYLSNAWEQSPQYTPEPAAVEAAITLDEVTHAHWQDIVALEPYGLGNTQPQFVFRDITVTAVRTFGKEGNHLSLSFTAASGRRINAIRFNHEQLLGDALPQNGDSLTLVATFDLNTYNGASELRLRIEDIV